MAHIIVSVQVEYEEVGISKFICKDSMEFPVHMVRHIQFGPLVGLVVERILDLVRKAGRSQDE
jgi:hypothetical protein